ncbi:hypothetical protein AABB24_024407 [Solanum stoloniferum]|uniref:Uncharacterized protein n=1 Tax=Solanum stoloniferum TaxID=62892 RepID=A0ABD2SNM3_9SOLN
MGEKEEIGVQEVGPSAWKHACLIIWFCVQENIFLRTKHTLNLGIATWLQHISERHDLIEVLRNVQILSINSTVLEGLSPKYVDFEYIDMELYLPNLKELQIVRYGLRFVNPCNFILFVKNCPQIERLFLDLGGYAMEAGSYWNSIAKEKFENCQIEFPQLKLLKVKGFKKLVLEEKLVNFFCSRAKPLESLIIVSKGNRLEIELYFFGKKI